MMEQADSARGAGKRGSLYRDALEGIYDGLLLAPFYLPIAAPYVVLARTEGLGPFSMVLWSALCFAGNAQMACLAAIGASAGLGTLLIITLLINMRHGLIGMALTPYVRGNFRGWSLALFCSGIGSASAGLIPRRAAARRGSLKAYGLAAQLCQQFQWVIFSLAGVWLGPLIPPAWDGVLYFAVPSAFLGLAASMIREAPRSGIASALVAAPLSLLLCLFLAPQTALVFSALAGAGAALFFD